NVHDFRVKIRFTPFGHLGIFPEQLVNWRLLKKLGSALPHGAEALNLFAYSGLSTLACLSGGMAVCHLDASKGMVEWARENAAASNLAAGKVRWIVEDVVKFIKREVKRKRPYAGVILDPPTFGRGSKGEVWKIERDLPELLDHLIHDLCGGEPEFVILTCHSTGFTAHTLARLLAGRIAAGHRDRGRFVANELFIPEHVGRTVYPSGSAVVFLSKRLQHLAD
ncbi:MAG: class I SAM-dependent methyltransferase, partial [Leptospirales bacterium]